MQHHAPREHTVQRDTQSGAAAESAEHGRDSTAQRMAAASLLYGEDGGVPCPTDGGSRQAAASHRDGTARCTAYTGEHSVYAQHAAPRSEGMRGDATT